MCVYCGSALSQSQIQQLKDEFPGADPSPDVQSELPDLPADITTSATMAPDSSFEAGLNQVGDRDWVEITLAEGEYYQFNLDGDGANALSDPYLRLYDGSGQLVAFNDDFNGLNSQLTYQAGATGTFYISAGAYNDSRAGDYEITVATVAPPPPAGPLDSIFWGTQLSDNTISVYFAGAGESYDGYTSEGFTAYEMQQFQEAFDLIETLIDVEFVVTNDPSADLRLVLDTNEIGAGGFLGYFNPPGTAGAGIGVFNGAAWDRTPGGDLEVGGFGFITIVHEFGHALGLAHPHDNGGSSDVMDGVGGPFGSYGDYDLNQGIYSMMSYNDGWQTGPAGTGGHGGGLYGYQANFMALDIAALQSLYGANTTTHSGDTLYRLPNSNGAGTYWTSIYDVSGTDEIRHTGSTDVTINLRDATLLYEEGGGGFISYVDGIAGGFTIANGTVIENATGANGDDSIIGNDADNVLKGRGGTDTMSGGAGDDTLIGGGNGDSLDGGDGNDTIKGENGQDTLNGGAGDDALVGGLHGDTFKFEDDFGKDRVTDYAENDLLDFTDFREDNGGSALTIDQLLITQNGANVIIRLDLDMDGKADKIDLDGDGDLDNPRVVLKNTLVADMDAGDFVF